MPPIDLFIKKGVDFTKGAEAILNEDGALKLNAQTKSEAFKKGETVKVRKFPGSENEYIISAEKGGSTTILGSDDCFSVAYNRERK